MVFFAELPSFLPLSRFLFLHQLAKSTSERMDVVKRANALLSVRAGTSYTEAAKVAGYKSKVLSELRTRREIFTKSGECPFQNERSAEKRHAQRCLFGGKVGKSLCHFLTVF
jgi:DNA helicase IV